MTRSRKSSPRAIVPPALLADPLWRGSAFVCAACGRWAHCSSLPGGLLRAHCATCGGAESLRSPGRGRIIPPGEPRREVVRTPEDALHRIFLSKAAPREIDIPDHERLLLANGIIRSRRDPLDAVVRLSVRYCPSEIRLRLWTSHSWRWLHRTGDHPVGGFLLLEVGPAPMTPSGFVALDEGGRMALYGDPGLCWISPMAARRAVKLPRVRICPTLQDALDPVRAGMGGIIDVAWDPFKEGQKG